jgi:hypothetical protein
MTSYRKTTFFEKLSASIINSLLALLITLPVALIFGFGSAWKIATVATFFLTTTFFMIFNKNRDLGMIFNRTYWEMEYSLKQKVVYNLLYTLSFSTLFVKIFFPFDLFLINILFLQLPIIYLTGTTLHGYLSGRITTVKR